VAATSPRGARVHAGFNLLYFLFAAALSVAWFYIRAVRRANAAAQRGALAAGVVLLWGTFAMLWMPWADYQKSYRLGALQLRSKTPGGHRCVAAKQLGVPQAGGAWLPCRPAAAARSTF